MGNEPKLIRTWNELKDCISNTHILEIDVDMCSGWIRPKNSDGNTGNYFADNCYLSTHTFYGSSYQHSTRILQDFGFNVQLANWDE